MADHPIAHLEIPAANTGAAGKFYSDVFGWKIETNPTYNYVTFQSEGGLRGGIVEPTAGTPSISWTGCWSISRLTTSRPLWPQ